MKLYYHIEDRADLSISDNNEDGYFMELGEFDDDVANRWLKAQSDWADAEGEIFTIISKHRARR